MAYLKINGAVSDVMAFTGPTLTVKTGEGTRFGDPTPERPLLLQSGVRGADVASAYLECTGRSGDVLAVSLRSGTVTPGHAVSAGEDAEWWGEPPETIAGLIEAGANVAVTGGGTATSPYVIAATGGGGEPGVGVPAGGASGQVLVKTSGADYATDWTDPPAADLSDYPTRFEVDTALATKASTVAAGLLDGRLTTAEGQITGLQSSKADASALANYATTSALSTGLAAKADASALSNYATTSAMTTALAAKADASALSGYATTSALSSGLAAKEDSLPTGGASGQFLAHDKVWRAPPRHKTYSWVVAVDSAGTLGDMGIAIKVPFDCTVRYTRMEVLTNPTGTVTANVKAGGVAVHPTGLSLGVGSGGLAENLAGFTIGTIPKNTVVVPSTTALPSDARAVRVEVELREVV